MCKVGSFGFIQSQNVFSQYRKVSCGHKAPRLSEGVRQVSAEKQAHNKEFQRTPNTQRLIAHAYGIIAQTPLRVRAR